MEEGRRRVYQCEAVGRLKVGLEKCRGGRVRSRRARSAVETVEEGNEDDEEGDDDCYSACSHLLRRPAAPLAPYPSEENS